LNNIKTLNNILYNLNGKCLLCYKKNNLNKTKYSQTGGIRLSTYVEGKKQNVWGDFLGLT